MARSQTAAVLALVALLNGVALADEPATSPTATPVVWTLPSEAPKNAKEALAVLNKTYEVLQRVRITKEDDAKIFLKEPATAIDKAFDLSPGPERKRIKAKASFIRWRVAMTGILFATTKGELRESLLSEEARRFEAADALDLFLNEAEKK